MLRSWIVMELSTTRSICGSEGSRHEVSPLRGLGDNGVGAIDSRGSRPWLKEFRRSAASTMLIDGMESRFYDGRHGIYGDRKVMEEAPTHQPRSGDRT